LYNTYEGKKVDRVAMFEVRSREKTTKNKPPKKNIVVNSEKKWTMMNPFDVEWKKNPSSG
jgi:hypothetical protein